MKRSLIAIVLMVFVGFIHFASLAFAEGADEFYNKALDEYKQGQYPEAVADFTRTIEVNSADAGAFYGRGLSYMRQGKYIEAISDLSRCLEIDPANEFAYYSRGLAYRVQKDPVKAISDFSKAIELNPKHSMFYSSRGRAYLDQDNFINAIPDLQHFIEMSPDQTDQVRVDLAKAFYLSANRYDEQLDAEKAILDYTKSIEFNPDFAGSYNNRAIDWFLLKQYDKAWQDVEKTKELGGAVHPGFISELKKASGRE